MKEIEIVPDGFKGERPEIRRAREKALILLSYTDYTEKRMREKLEGISDKWSLKTVWGVGYKFETLV